MRYLAFAGFIVAALAPASGQEKHSTGPDEARKAVVAALEQSKAKGGVLLKGHLDKKRPSEIEMGGIVLDVSTGPEVQGDFTARLGKSGCAAVTFATEKVRYELFCLAGKKVHRLSWSEGGVPMPAEIAFDLSRLLRWDLVVKHLAEKKDFMELTDSTVDGVKCRVVKGALASALLARPEKGGADEKDDPWDWEVGSISGIFHVGREDKLIRRMEIKVTRQFELDANQDPLECVNQYVLTVQKYDPDLEVEVPAELGKLLH